MLSERAGARRAREASRCSPTGCSPSPTPRPRTGSCATPIARSCAVVDSVSAGGRSNDGRALRAPRRAGRGDRRARPRRSAPDTLVIGVAPMGGALTPRVARGAARGGRRSGCDARGRPAHGARRRPGAGGGRREAGVAVRDLRAAPADLSVPTGSGRTCASSTRVGSDCAIGKMSVTLELDARRARAGCESAFVATGQTGIAITGWGIAVDHVISDYIAGAAARLVERGRGAGGAAVRRGPGRARAPGLLGRDARAAARLPAGRARALPSRRRDPQHRLPGAGAAAAVLARGGLRGRGRLGAAGARGRRWH